MVQSIGVDFDGVIHAYSRGWQDGSIYDQPVPGALQALTDLRTTYAVFIHTSRAPHDVAEWITERGVLAVSDFAANRPTFWNDQTQVLVTNRKLPAIAYIDDRAIRFTSWPQALAELAAPIDWEAEHAAYRRMDNLLRVAVDKLRKINAITQRAAGFGEPPMVRKILAILDEEPQR